MKKVLLGVTGSIAAYKSAELVRLMKKSGFDVRVIMTVSATEFITPMTMQVLSQNEVRVDTFNHEDESKIDHISLARWADQIIIAPLTANTLAKIAHGIADDLLTTICLATQTPIAIAPAMNKVMWENKITQNNLQILLTNNYQLIAPESGEQACGEFGDGRMAEPQNIFDNLFNDKKENKPLNGINILITAGPTVERIDPVRFISNDSSGKMGYALANQAIELGANVTIISGKVNSNVIAHPDVKIISIETAVNMYDRVMQEIHHNDWFIAAAAVSDYKISNPSQQKLKKLGDDGITLQLSQNPDILKSVCLLKKSDNQFSDLFTIGFAAETNNIIENASNKRIKKGVDLICANDVSDENIGFNSEQNAITLIANDFSKKFPTTDKKILANQLLLAFLDYKNTITNHKK